MTSFKLIDTTSTDIKEGKTLCTAKQQRFATRHFLSDTIIQNFLSLNSIKNLELALSVNG
jgi:hypothetical protein